MISAIIIGLLAGYIACLLLSKKNKIFGVFGFEAYGGVAELIVSVGGSIILLWLWAKIKK